MSEFKDNIIEYVKLLIYKCSGMKSQLRAPIEDRFIYATPKIEEKSDLKDIFTLTFGKEIIHLEIHYELRPRLVKRKNYDTDEVYEVSNGEFEYFVNDIK